MTVPLHAKGDVPRRPTIYACERPEDRPSAELGYDPRCRSCMVAAVAHARAGWMGIYEMDGQHGTFALPDIVRMHGDELLIRALEI